MPPLIGLAHRITQHYTTSRDLTHGTRAAWLHCCSMHSAKGS